jgi:hypothetical protein
MPPRSADRQPEKWLDTDPDYRDAGTAFAEAAGSAAVTRPEALALLTVLARADKHCGSSLTTVLPAPAGR